jgi:hypothetical protein
LTASKAGFVDMTYGAKRPGRPGTPIQLGEGQKLDKAHITLPRGSVITGLVVDEHGEPATGTQVRALRYVMRSGERALQQVGQDQTDDRGIYRIFGLQPGEHVVYSVPRNQNISNLQQTMMAEIESLMQQAQAAGVEVGRGGGRGGRGELGIMLGGGGGRGQQLLDRARELQDQLQQAQQDPQVAYAPVYYPGTATPSGASSVTIGVGDERGGIDFQLQLVPTARIEGSIASPDGTLPQGTQISLVPADRGGMPSIPGIGTSQTRVGADGRFSFSNITPGQYTLQARAVIRAALTQAEIAAMAARGGGGRGGRGFEGPGGRGGQIAQVLWASSDVSVTGTNIQNVALQLQPGMTVSGQINFETGTGNRPTDMSNVRINLSPRGQQTFEMGPAAPAQVDAGGRFTITGVAPGRYMISANVPGARGGGPGGGGGRGGVQGQPQTAATPQMTWYLKSAMTGGREALDFPIEVMPNGDVSGMALTFTDKTQELSGVIQDAVGQPTADFTIVVFPADNRYWLPQSRRIAAVRPGTDGRFTFRNLPPGEYRMTAITDAEPGEWYDPAFLGQLATASIPVSIAEGQKKVQDIRLAGGGG